jgi:hypothetical protein
MNPSMQMTKRIYKFGSLNMISQPFAYAKKGTMVCAHSGGFEESSLQEPGYNPPFGMAVTKQ